MISAGSPPFDPVPFLDAIGEGHVFEPFPDDCRIFAQGDAADAVFYIGRGQVKLTIVSPHGKEAVVAILNRGGFFGEGCLAGQAVRMNSAIARGDCLLVAIKKPVMTRALHEQPEFANLFITHLLTRNIRSEEDLADQLFNSSEKRLARILLLLADSAPYESDPEAIPPIGQETLAEMIGTTRSRVSFFLNKFRSLGFIDYHGENFYVHASLLSVLEEKPIATTGRLRHPVPREQF